MVIDASVWVAAFLAGDTHHRDAAAFLHKLLEDGQPAVVPLLGLSEIAGAISRQTGNPELAEKSISFLRSQSWLQFVPLNELLAMEAASFAARWRLRGADAVYVALASQQDGVLITLDREMLRRTPETVTACTPEEWLKRA